MCNRVSYRMHLQLFLIGIAPQYLVPFLLVQNSVLIDGVSPVGFADLAVSHRFTAAWFPPVSSLVVFVSSRGQEQSYAPFSIALVYDGAFFSCSDYSVPGGNVWSLVVLVSIDNFLGRCGMGI